MSTYYNGNPANVSQSLSATINGATNASPIVVSTTSAHGFFTGDKVLIVGVVGNTAANGIFTITVTDSTHFSLNSTTGSGVYTSGGTAVDLRLLPPAQLPSDGDTLNVASVNAALQTLFDRTQFNSARTRDAAYTVLNAGSAGGGSGAHNWAGNFSIAENLGVVSIAGLKNNDVVELDWWGPLLPAASTGATVSARLAVSENASSFTDAGATWSDANNTFGMQQFGDTVVRWPIYLSCTYNIVAAAPSTVKFVVQVNGSTVSGGVNVPTTGTPTPTWGYRYRTLRAVIS